MIDIEYTNRSVVTAHLALFIRWNSYATFSRVETYCNQFIDEYCDGHPDFAKRLEESETCDLMELGNILITEYCTRSDMTADAIAAEIKSFEEYIYEETMRPFHHYPYSMYTNHTLWRNAFMIQKNNSKTNPPKATASSPEFIMEDLETGERTAADDLATALFGPGAKKDEYMFQEIKKESDDKK